MNILAIDSSVAGVSGDMLFASLIGLTDNPQDVLKQITNTMTTNAQVQFKLSIQEQSYHGFSGYKINITGGDQKLNTSQLKALLDRSLEKSLIPELYQEIGKTALQNLLEAEIGVHNVKDIPLHELGTLDTFIDIFATTFLLYTLQIDGIQLSPIATGSGSIKTRHGLLPVPPPATDYILQKSKLQTTTGPNGEAATPTGVALLAAIAEHLEIRENNITWEESSFGFGDRQWPDRGNFLRTRLGKNVNELSKISVLETHLDDISGEILGYAVDILLENGALDVSYYPLIMKKGRPAYCLRVLAPNELVGQLSDDIIRLTGTLGVRIMEVNRHIGNRTSENITTILDNKKISFSIKHGPYGSKIEFEDIKRLSEELGIPPKNLHEKLMLLVNSRTKKMEVD